MNRNELDPTVRPSVLDRLIDNEPQNAGDPPLTWDASVARLRDSVRRDLEWLLNTRRIPTPAPAEYPELQQSVYHFGLPDITSLSRDSSETPETLRRQIEEIVRLFEPRLMNVQVQPQEGGTNPLRELHFTIHALLRMEPNPERVVFDTVLEVGSGEFSVTGDIDA